MSYNTIEQRTGPPAKIEPWALSEKEALSREMRRVARSKRETPDQYADRVINGLPDDCDLY